MTTTNMDELKKTPLCDAHVSLGAKMAPFGGWLMPIQYSGIIDEHLHCRDKSALFDTSHMGEFLIRGDAQKCGLDAILSFRLTDLAIGRSRYGCMLSESGGIIDDLIIFRLGSEEWLIVVNAGTKEKDARHIMDHLIDRKAFLDLSEKMAKLDLQGPSSDRVLRDSLGVDPARLKYFSFDQFDFLGEKNTISRTGYTGEYGFEIFITPEKLPLLWAKLLAHGDVKPAGLGARDTLRLEMGYSLYGSDIDENTTPLDVGLDCFVHFEKDFIGKEALLQQKSAGKNKTKIAFKTLTRRAPRSHFRIFSGTSELGSVTSGSFSPSLSCGIGLGLIESSFLPKDILLKKGDISLEAKVETLPFFKSSSLRK